MAPRELPSAKAQRSALKMENSVPKGRSSPAGIKKSKTVKKLIEKIPLKKIDSTAETVPKPVCTPKSKDKVVPQPSSSVKKSNWKRRPKPAHSGVPMPEKMKKLFQDSKEQF